MKHENFFVVHLPTSRNNQENVKGSRGIFYSSKDLSDFHLISQLNLYLSYNSSVKTMYTSSSFTKQILNVDISHLLGPSSQQQQGFQFSLSYNSMYYKEEMLLITNQKKCYQRTPILHLSTERSPKTDKISFKRYHNIISQIVIKIDHFSAQLFDSIGSSRLPAL